MGNMFKAINTYTDPLLIYSLGIIHWTDMNKKRIQRKTNKFLTNARFHHPKAATERLPVQRTCGVTGLIVINNYT
jgi:hypothetical protein